MKKNFSDKELESIFDATWEKIPQEVRDGIQGQLRLVTDKYVECQATSYIFHHPELDAVTYSERGQIDIYLDGSSILESEDKAEFVIARELARIHLGDVVTLKSIQHANWNEEQYFMLAEEWGFSYGEGY